MKNKIITILTSLFILTIVITAVVILIVNKNKKPFYLDSNYYGTDSIKEIRIDELNRLIDNKNRSLYSYINLSVLLHLILKTF